MRPMREEVKSSSHSYFVSTQAVERRPFFRHERWGRLMIAVLRHYAETEFTLHAYVVMPDHVHMLITPRAALEKAVQVVKGGFSFRARREFGWKSDIWQPGFTDHRIRGEEDWIKHLEYIRANPVNAHLVEHSALYKFIGFPSVQLPQGLKPLNQAARDVRAEARTLQAHGRSED
jgi:REP-associated tyrosine transposase